MKPPPEIKSGGYGAYLFILSKPANLPQRTDRTRPEVQLITVPRLGASVVYEVQGTIQRKGNLLKLEMTPPTKTVPLKIRHEFENTGNAEVVLDGSFHITDSKNALVGKGTLRPLKTFPGEKAVTETTWPQSLPPGHYTLLVTLELGPDGREAIVREIPFEVS